MILMNLDVGGFLSRIRNLHECEANCHYDRRRHAAEQQLTEIIESYSSRFPEAVYIRSISFTTFLAGLFRTGSGSLDTVV